LSFGREDVEGVPYFSLGRGETRPYRRWFCHAEKCAGKAGGVNFLSGQKAVAIFIRVLAKSG
jgi:hypothetical protein